MASTTGARERTGKKAARRPWFRMASATALVTDRLLALGVESGLRQGKRMVVLTSEVPRFRFGSRKSVEPFFSAGRALVENNRQVSSMLPRVFAGRKFEPLR